MDWAAIGSFIATVGFPIFCAVAMGIFIVLIYKNTTKQHKEDMEQVQERCKEREDKLYNELEQNREINRTAIETIARYAEKLDTIQKDISDIKTDITVLMSK
jgi:septal ring factor EnvC (AmiA/AmiB activator)